jgi:hypothetical protein
MLGFRFALKRRRLRPWNHVRFNICIVDVQSDPAGRPLQFQV